MKRVDWVQLVRFPCDFFRIRDGLGTLLLASASIARPFKIRVRDRMRVAPKAVV
jgi:hypothetical protein